MTKGPETEDTFPELGMGPVYNRSDGRTAETEGIEGTDGSDAPGDGSPADDEHRAANLERVNRLFGSDETEES